MVFHVKGWFLGIHMQFFNCMPNERFHEDFIMHLSLYVYLTSDILYVISETLQRVHGPGSLLFALII